MLALIKPSAERTSALVWGRGVGRRIQPLLVTGKTKIIAETGRDQEAAGLCPWEGRNECLAHIMRVCFLLQSFSYCKNIFVSYSNSFQFLNKPLVPGSQTDSLKDNHTHLENPPMGSGHLGLQPYSVLGSLKETNNIAHFNTILWELG